MTLPIKKKDLSSKMPNWPPWKRRSLG